MHYHGHAGWLLNRDHTLCDGSQSGQETLNKELAQRLHHTTQGGGGTRGLGSGRVAGSGSAAASKAHLCSDTSSSQHEVGGVIRQLQRLYAGCFSHLAQPVAEARQGTASSGGADEVPAALLRTGMCQLPAVRQQRATQQLAGRAAVATVLPQVLLSPLQSNSIPAAAYAAAVGVTAVGAAAVPGTATADTAADTAAGAAAAGSAAAGSAAAALGTGGGNTCRCCCCWSSEFDASQP